MRPDSIVTEADQSVLENNMTYILRIGREGEVDIR
jgi:hypothetical protein